jgi:L-lysine 6-transaminase
LSLTNTGDIKTKWFPKFNWTRVVNPKIHFPIQEHNVSRLEEMSLENMERSLKRYNVAAIIFETIQGEGGDNHFRPEFFKAVRELADQYEALLILDEVQSGMGLTGKWWAYEHYGIKPDLIAFGKKTQVCGIAGGERMDLVNNNVFKLSGRINSTWGGNIVDMARSKVIIDVIKEENLIQNSADVGEYFTDQLKNIQSSEVENVRGKGLMIAFDLPTASRRDYVLAKMQDRMLALKSGTRSIRFRPCLTFSRSDVDTAIDFIRASLC